MICFYDLLINFVLTCAYGVHCNENIIYVFLFWELRGLSPNYHIQHSCVCEQFINIIPRIQVHIFSCSRIGRSIEGICKSQTDTWMWKLGLWLRNFFFMNICFEFSVLCLCSVLFHNSTLPFSIFRIQNSAFRIFRPPNSVFRIPCFAFRIPHSLVGKETNTSGVRFSACSSSSMYFGLKSYFIKEKAYRFS